MKSKKENLGTVLAQRTLSSIYTAITSVEIDGNPKGNHGLATIGRT